MSHLTFKYTILYVENVAQTLEFYEKAFGLKQARLHESGDYGELDTGNTILAFASRTLIDKMGKNPGSADPKIPTFEIAFETEDVPSALSKALMCGAKLIQDTQQMPWGQKTAYVADNNGFLVELCTPVSNPS